MMIRIRSAMSFCIAHKDQKRRIDERGQQHQFHATTQTVAYVESFWTWRQPSPGCTVVTAHFRRFSLQDKYGQVGIVKVDFDRKGNYEK